MIAKSSHLSVAHKPGGARVVTRSAWLIVCGLSLLLTAPQLAAEELTHDEMVCALNPECTKPIAARTVRGVTASASTRVPGSFDRTVNFAFDSAELTPEGRMELDAVAKAINDPSINKYELLISGHTDGVGSVEYNQVLSERRAEAARQYLITAHGIDPNRLVSKGYGKSQLLLPDDPSNGFNRRVQFSNPNYSTASVPPGRATRGIPAGAPALLERPSRR